MCVMWSLCWHHSEHHKFACLIFLLYWSNRNYKFQTGKLHFVGETGHSIDNSIASALIELWMYLISCSCWWMRVNSSFYYLYVVLASHLAHLIYHLRGLVLLLSFVILAKHNFAVHKVLLQIWCFTWRFRSTRSWHIASLTRSWLRGNVRLL